MQKTIVFGKRPISQQNLSPTLQGKFKCKNCEKLQAQLTELTLLSNNFQGEINLEFSAESSTVKSVTVELIDLREKYEALKKKLVQFDKENNGLFDENTKLTRQLKACQIELKELLKRKKEPLLLESESEYLDSEDETVKKELESPGPSKFDHQKIIAQIEAQFEREKKEIEVQMFVWKQKTERLEVLTKDQSDEIGKLKELLMRRNRLQEQRHHLLETLCF